MSTDTNTSKLIINELTKAQFEEIETPSDTELYMVTDASMDISDVDGLQTALNNKAPIQNANLTGTPTAPTASVNTNTTQIATTAFVKSYIRVVDELPANPDSNTIYIVTGA